VRTVTTLTALLLDGSNIVGGLLLAAALLRDVPRLGPPLARLTGALARAGVAIGVLALVMGGYYLILHLTSGPHVFHFEVVGLGVGVGLLRERLFPPGAAQAADPTPTQPTPTQPAPAPPSTGSMPYLDTRVPPPPPAPTAPSSAQAPVTGAQLLLAVFGLIAIVIGIQGLLTPDS